MRVLLRIPLRVLLLRILLGRYARRQMSGRNLPRSRYEAAVLVDSHVGNAAVQAAHMSENAERRLTVIWLTDKLHRRVR